MKEYSVLMSLFDYVPVVLFAVGAVILQRDFYERMTKGPFALFSAGTIDVICAGFLKATYKLLYALGICDFQPLNAMFFPVQSIGFLLAGIAMVSIIGGKDGADRPGAKAYSVAAVPALWNGTFLFVGLMVAGLGLMDYGLIKLCARNGRKRLIVLFVISFICCLGMGYLSSKNFESSAMNWVAELVNCAGQGTFLLGTVFLHKALLKEAGKTE